MTKRTVYIRQNDKKWHPILYLGNGLEGRTDDAIQMGKETSLDIAPLQGDPGDDRLSTRPCRQLARQGKTHANASAMVVVTSAVIEGEKIGANGGKAPSLDGCQQAKLALKLLDAALVGGHDGLQGGIGYVETIKQGLLLPKNVFDRGTEHGFLSGRLRHLVINGV